MRLVWLVSCLVLVLTGGAEVAFGQSREDDVRATLGRIEQQLEQQRVGAAELDAEAQAQEAEHNRVRAEIVVAARIARGYEHSILKLEQELVDIDARVERTQGDLEARSRALEGTLVALQRLAMRPQWAMLAQPEDPNQTVRGGLVMRVALPQIRERAERLRLDLVELARLRADAADRRVDLAEANDRLRAERKQLAVLAEQKASLAAQSRQASDEATARIQRLVDEARDLADLLQMLDGERRARVADEERKRAEAEALQRQTRQREERLAAVRPRQRPDVAAQPMVPISEARGTLVPPASGQILVHYGESTAFGATAKGITYSTWPGAQVVAPYDGRVAFAGPFRHFGLILIIEHGEGYHSLLAGLAQIDATVGQWLITGEPVGTTGWNGDQHEPNDGANRPAGVERERSPTLYVELRREGQPINPLPWLAASNEKVRG